MRKKIVGSVILLSLAFTGCGESGGKSIGGSSSGPGTNTSPPPVPGDLSTFTLSPNAFPAGRYGAAGVKIGSKAYVLGGGSSSGSGSSTAIYEAAIDSDGVLGAFTTSAETLSIPVEGASAQVVGNYLYIIGGQTDSTTIVGVQRAPIDANGLTGSFTTYANSLVTARSYFSVLATSNYLYIIGGKAGFSSTSSIERASIDTSTGTVGTFATDTNVLVTARWTHAGVLVGDSYYVMGGEGSGGSLDSLEKATVNSDGTITNFTTDSVTLAGPRNRVNSVVVANKKLYIFGGWDSGDFLTSVESSTITNNALGAFTTQPGVTLAQGMESGVSFLTSHYFYYVSGYNYDGTSTIIQQAPATQ